MLARRDESWSPCPRLGHWGWGMWERGPVNPDHLKSTKRTFGLTVEKARRKCSRGEKCEWWRGGEKEEEKARIEERNSESPVQMEATPPKASPASSPPSLRELSSHSEHAGLFWWWRGGGAGTRFHRAMTKLVLPTLLP